MEIKLWQEIDNKQTIVQLMTMIWHQWGAQGNNLSEVDSLDWKLGNHKLKNEELKKKNEELMLG